LSFCYVDDAFKNRLNQGCFDALECVPADSLQNLLHGIVFDYDHINCRRGNTIVLQRLNDVFTLDCIKSFFRGMIDLLRYKEDQFDLMIFKPLIFSTKITKTFQRPQAEVTSIEMVVPTPTTDQINQLGQIEPTAASPKQADDPVKQPEPHQYVLFQYFDDVCQQIWIKDAEAKSTLEILLQIKRSHPKAFTKAYNAFFASHPGASLYSLKS
jgi:hypothetical protein